MDDHIVAQSHLVQLGDVGIPLILDTAIPLPSGFLPFVVGFAVRVRFIISQVVNELFNVI